MIFYKPSSDNCIADVWCIKKDGLWYIFGCQTDGISVATSPDLVDITFRKIIFPGGWFGGDVFKWKGSYHMVYSHPGDKSNIINIAHSDDLLNWNNDPNNPILSFPDPRWYDGTAYKDSLRGISNCRDPEIILDASNSKWIYMCFAGDTGRGDVYRRGCIGLARSNDLIHWEYLPPLFAPGTSTLMEVPRVCRFGRKWVLTWLGAPWYGLRANEDTPRRSSGNWPETFIQYAIAGHPLGPYRMPKNNILLQGQFSPYVIDFVQDANKKNMVVCNMFLQKGENWFSRERGGLIPVMPVSFSIRMKNVLEISFPGKITRYFKQRLELTKTLKTNFPVGRHDDIKMTGRRISFKNVSNRIVELTGTTNRDIIINVDYNVNKGRAGIITRYAGRTGCGMLVDPHRNELQFVEVCPMFANAVIFKAMERHIITQRVGKAFSLRVIQSLDYQQVFINNILTATFSFSRREEGTAGLLIENATGDCTVNSILLKRNH